MSDYRIEAATKEEWAGRALRAEFRMEILEAELIAAEQRGYANAMEAERKLHEERIEELEAKLAKAVDALDWIGNHMVMSMALNEDHLCRVMKQCARTTLAELEGETDA
jgi:hypothetical protein